jgi:hypothetical protein
VDLAGVDMWTGSRWVWWSLGEGTVVASRRPSLARIAYATDGRSEDAITVALAGCDRARRLGQVHGAGAIIFVAAACSLLERESLAVVNQLFSELFEFDLRGADRRAALEVRAKLRLCRRDPDAACTDLQALQDMDAVRRPVSVATIHELLAHFHLEKSQPADAKVTSLHRAHRNCARQAGCGRRALRRRARCSRRRGGSRTGPRRPRRSQGGDLARSRSATPNPGGDAGIEVTHEALLTHWSRLAGWLAADVHGRELRRHLAPAAADSDATGRPDAELYRGAPLASALDWAGDELRNMGRYEMERPPEYR